MVGKRYMEPCKTSEGEEKAGWPGMGIRWKRVRRRGRKKDVGLERVMEEH